MRDLRATRTHLQSYRLIAPVRDLFLGVVDPIIKGIGLIQPGTVLLDAPAPNIVVGIEVEGPAPAVNRCLEITGSAVLGLVTTSIPYAEAELCDRVFRIDLGRALIGFQSEVHVLLATPQGQRVAEITPCGQTFICL